jgi:hypothetical protein
MSTDYTLKCLRCNKVLDDDRPGGVSFIASASIAYGEKLWRSDQIQDALRDFLFEHLGHELVFDDSQAFD